MPGKASPYATWAYSRMRPPRRSRRRTACCLPLRVDGCARRTGTLPQRSVRPMSVVMVGVLREGTTGTAARPAGVMRPGSCLTDAERSKEARMLRALPENREQAMLGRDRRHERREERREARRDGPEVTRYQMLQRMISIGDDYV